MIISSDLVYSRYDYSFPTMSEVGRQRDAHLVFLQATAKCSACLMKVMNPSIVGLTRKVESAGGYSFLIHS